MSFAFLLPALSFLKGVPWQIYAGLALLVAFPVTYCQGVDNGREQILAELKEAERLAEIKAQEALKEATEEAAERAETFEAEQKVLSDAIENAEASGANPLDGLFGSLSAED